MLFWMLWYELIGGNGIQAHLKVVMNAICAIWIIIRFLRRWQKPSFTLLYRSSWADVRSKKQSKGASRKTSNLINIIESVHRSRYLLGSEVRHHHHSATTHSKAVFH